MLKINYPATTGIIPEFDLGHKEIMEKIFKERWSMASAKDICSTMNAAQHVATRSIDGDFVECGVWAGGNAIAVKKIFQMYNCNKKVFCFDTFKGMVEPSEIDKSDTGHRENPQQFYLENQKSDHNEWCYASLENVKRNFESYCGTENVVFIEGDVRETLLVETNLPEKISVLRLDTDWYESTKVEIEILYPRLSVGGVLLLDDYGCWAGHRQAVDEYFNKLPVEKRPMLQFISEKGRCAIKL